MGLLLLMVLTISTYFSSSRSIAERIRDISVDFGVLEFFLILELRRLGVLVSVTFDSSADDVVCMIVTQGSMQPELR